MVPQIYLIWNLVLAMLGLLNSHVTAQGPGWCWNPVRSLINVRETFTESSTKRTATCCDWLCVSKCSSYRVVYRIAYRNAVRIIYKAELGCCYGWTQMNGHCVPSFIPDGPASATLIPAFQPERPPSSGANNANNDPSSAVPADPGGTTNQVDADSSTNADPILPVAPPPNEGGIYVMKKLRSEAWAATHPGEMTGIVGLLAAVVVIGLVSWTVHRKRQNNDVPAMVRISKADVARINHAPEFQYEVTIMGGQKSRNGRTSSTSTISTFTDDHGSLASTQRESVYEIHLPDDELDSHYTVLNVGNRELELPYTPLQIAHIGLPEFTI